MTDITDKITALGPRFKVEPVRLRNGVQVTGVESDGSYKTAPTYTEYVTLASYERATAERDLALEVLRELASAADEVDVRHFTDSCSHSALVMRERVVAARAVLAACGKEEG